MNLNKKNQCKFTPLEAKNGLTKIIKKALLIDLKLIYRSQSRRLPASSEEFTDIVFKIKKTFDYPDLETIEKAIFLIFLRGVSNRTVPDSFEVEISGFTLTKRDLALAYQAVTNDTVLRRLGESIVEKISEFCIATKREGKLAKQIKARLKLENKQPLNLEERCYCYSFLGKMDPITLIKNSSTRMSHLLEEDSQERLNKSPVKILKSNIKNKPSQAKNFTPPRLRDYPWNRKR